MMPRQPAPGASLLVVAWLMGWGTGDIGAQERSAPAAPTAEGVWRSVGPTEPELPGWSGPSASATLRSLALPGWGQWTLGQRRGAAYLAAEAALWVVWADRRARAGDLRDGYRDLAWTAARGGTGPRRDGPWSYYETLTKWRRSGAFDRDPSAPGIQPEEDPSTFNGSVWSLARAIHLGGGNGGPGDPRHAAAVAWYGERAWGEDFLWDWTGKEPALAEFRDLIDGSDRRFRQATSVLGAVLANHLLSGADAFLSSRTPAVPKASVAPAFATPTGGGVQLLLTWNHLP